AIESNPAACEAWKRRGQARAALGEFAESVEDLTEALVLEPKSPDIFHERGEPLGCSFTSCFIFHEEAHSKSIQLDSNYLEAWLHLAQHYQELADHHKAMECTEHALQVDNRKAIQELSIGLSIENSIECLYLRGSCYHAVGEYRDAVKDYDATVDVELDAVEKFVLQCLAFYQVPRDVFFVDNPEKEIALYTASKASREFSCFDIDGDLDPMFKEYWCKRLNPKDVCEKVYRQPPLRESLKKDKLKKQDLAITKPKANLLCFTDFIGKKIQYGSPGFLPNRRQKVYSVMRFCLIKWNHRYLIWCYCRTLNLAKTIIKEKLYVRSKADKVIDLSKDEKIEEVGFPIFLT
ncbi:hypothetical protein F2Q68_00037997, partial [Brassica cretica]